MGNHKLRDTLLVIRHLRSIGLLIVLVLTTNQVLTQETVQSNFQPQLNVEPETAVADKDPLSVGLNLNFGLVGQFSGNTLSYQEINPNLRYNLSNRFSLFGGISYSVFQNMDIYYIKDTENSFETFNSNFSLGTIHVGGSYMASPRLRVDGTVWKRVTLNNNSKVLLNNQTNFDAQGLNLRLNYQISDKVQIEASFNYSRGNDIYSNPFTPYTTSPFLNNGFFPFNR
ncbi:MAG: hypothetical protein KJ578_03785 [Bacteroidetes bacterium]|nr:hypothetical protein [Bacteroidota bacterium]MBU1577846.1 hypothetical protein [Bacteroidota bacterium]MBU2556882.1 hypothetical protein [Bacteroidota bacterium]